MSRILIEARDDLLKLTGGDRFATVLADPPWQFANRTGKMAPEHGRLFRYPTMTLDDICNLPIKSVAEERAQNQRNL